MSGMPWVVMIENKTWIITLLSSTLYILLIMIQNSKLTVMYCKPFRVYQLWTYRFTYLYCQYGRYVIRVVLSKKMLFVLLRWAHTHQMSSSLSASAQFHSLFLFRGVTVCYMLTYSVIRTFSQAAWRYTLANRPRLCRSTIPTLTSRMNIRLMGGYSG